MSNDYKVKKSIEDLGFDAPSESLKKGMSFVLNSKLPMPEKIDPKEIDELQFPRDLTKVSLDELGRLMSSWTAVMGYADYVNSMADVQKTAKQNAYNFAKKQLYLQLRKNDNLTEEERKAMIDANPEIAKKLAEYEAEVAVYKLTESILKNYRNYYKSLSRELSRRDNANEANLGPGNKRIQGAAGYQRQQDEEMFADGRKKAKNLFAQAFDFAKDCKVGDELIATEDWADNWTTGQVVEVRKVDEDGLVLDDVAHVDFADINKYFSLKDDLVDEE